LDQLPSNPILVSGSATDLPSISYDQLDQLQASTDPTDLQLIHEVITSKPLQEEGLRPTDPSDLLIQHPSEKLENQNVSDCVKFIRSAVEAAAKFVKFAADQVASLYTEFSDRTALAPNLAKILLAAERKGGKISIRDAQLAFTSKFRPNAQIARSWFGELVALDYGVVKKSTGKSVIFEIVAKPINHSSTRSSSTIAPNSIPVNISASTPLVYNSLQNLQLPSTDVDFVDEMIHVRLQTEPIQEEALRSVVDNDPLFATSEKFLTDENAQENIFEVFWQTCWGSFYKIGARALLKCPEQNFRKKVAPGMPNATDKKSQKFKFPYPSLEFPKDRYRFP
jgi:hypothetical protein